MILKVCIISCVIRECSIKGAPQIVPLKGWDMDNAELIGDRNSGTVDGKQ